MPLPAAPLHPTLLLLPRDCLLLRALGLLHGLRLPRLLWSLWLRLWVALDTPLLLRLLWRRLLCPLRLLLLPPLLLLRPLRLRLLLRLLCPLRLLLLPTLFLLRPLRLRLLLRLLGSLLLRLWSALFLSLRRLALGTLLSCGWRDLFRPALLFLGFAAVFLLALFLLVVLLRVRRNVHPEKQKQRSSPNASNGSHHHLRFIAIGAARRPTYSLVSTGTTSTTLVTGISSRCVTITGARSVGLSAVP